MADKPKSLLEGGADSLSEAAARFERLVQDVKSSQKGVAPSSPPPPAANPLLSVSPEEEWSRRFRTEAIGPEPHRLSPGDLAPLPRSVVVPPVAPAVVSPSRAVEPAPRLVPGAMGPQIGKTDNPRRSLIARLFGRV